MFHALALVLTSALSPVIPQSGRETLPAPQTVIATNNPPQSTSIAELKRQVSRTRAPVVTFDSSGKIREFSSQAEAEQKFQWEDASDKKHQESVAQGLPRLDRQLQIAQQMQEEKSSRANYLIGALILGLAFGAIRIVMAVLESFSTRPTRQVEFSDLGIEAEIKV